MGQKSRKFYTIGHISTDLIPQPHLNGTTVNAAIVAKNYGYESYIITKIPSSHPYLHQLEQIGIKVVNLPIRNKSYKSKITTFKNMFSGTKREQFLLDMQEPITLSDLGNMPNISNSIVLFAPLINEIDYRIIKILRQDNFLALTAQGYLRSVDSNCKIIKRKMDHKQEAMLANVNVVILSDEDITFNQAVDKDYLNKIIKRSKVVVLTKNVDGSEIFVSSSKKSIKIKTKQLARDTRYDYSGAGDVYAASFIIFLQNNPIVISGKLASDIATRKIMNASCGNYGIETIPTGKTVKDFLDIEELIGKTKEKSNSFLVSQKESHL